MEFLNRFKLFKLIWTKFDIITLQSSAENIDYMKLEYPSSPSSDFIP